MSTEQAIRDTLISPNVPDSNMEPANVVDVIAGAGLNISRAINKQLGTAQHNLGGLEYIGMSIREAGSEIAAALNRLAEALESK